MIGTTESPSTEASRWDIAGADSNLETGQVFVFFASLAQSLRVTGDLEALLSDDERLRARRFHFERDTRRFVAARSILRSILGRYLGAHPASLVFSFGSAGKPALAGRWSGALDFNLSHSVDGALYAVAVGRAVGVDLEYIRPLGDATDIAAQVFSNREKAIVARAADGETNRTFFACWTRKEAFIKATGHGLSLPLPTIDASLAPGQHSRVLSPSDVGVGTSNWMLYALDPHPAYAAALVAAGEACVVRCWQWPGV